KFRERVAVRCARPLEVEPQQQRYREQAECGIDDKDQRGGDHGRPRSSSVTAPRRGPAPEFLNSASRIPSAATTVPLQLTAPSPPRRPIPASAPPQHARRE